MTTTEKRLLLLCKGLHKQVENLEKKLKEHDEEQYPHANLMDNHECLYHDKEQES